MEACNSRRTPMKEKPVLSSVTCPDKSDDYKETFPYSSALGSLLYLRLTRPDILVVLSILARFMKNPQKIHWTAIKDVFKYIKGTLTRGLLYRASGVTLNDVWTLTLWVDSDYGTNQCNRRSRAGFLVFLNKNLIAFNSVLQRGSKKPDHDDGIPDEYPGVPRKPTPMDGEPLPSMASGTCEAEYMALSLAVRELVWIYMLLKTMGIKVRKPCVVYEDNRACVKIANNPTSQKRTKHIDIRHHFLREHIENGLIELISVSTAEQRADIMTKVLGKELFEHFREFITSNIDLTMIDKRTCAKCATTFKSRNKLFRHLQHCRKH